MSVNLSALHVHANRLITSNSSSGSSIRSQPSLRNYFLLCRKQQLLEQFTPFYLMLILFILCFVNMMSVNLSVVHAGAVLDGFLRFPETTQICLSTMGMAIFSYKASWSIHSVLNSSVTDFCFESKLRKSSDELFLAATKENWRPSQKFVLQRH